MAKKKLRPQKPNVENAIVTIDTSIVYTDNKKYIVCQDFENFLSEISGKSNLELYVPELVINEIVYQNISACHEKIMNINESLRLIGENVNKKYKNPANLAAIKAAADRKVRKWFKDNKIKVITTPYSKISIRELEEYALRHEAPFKDKTDQGVKDYLILKTIIGFRETNLSERFVFLCKDKSLIKAFRRSINEDIKTLIFDEINDYQNLIKLKYEQYSEQFITNVNRKATKRFYDFERRTGLYIDFKIPEKIKSDFADILNNPLVNDDPSNEANEGYIAIETAEYTLERAKYLKKEGNTYRFSSELKRKRKFKKAETFDFRETELVFEIFWRAKISKDGKFLDTGFDSIELVSRKSEPSVSDLLKNIKDLWPDLLAKQKSG